MAEKFFTVDLKKPCILVWPSLVEPKAYKDPKTGIMGKPKYQAHFCFKPDHPDIKRIKEMALDALRSKYDPDVVSTQDAKFPWRTGDQTADKRKAKGKAAEFFREYALVMIANSPKYVHLGEWVDGRAVQFHSEADRKAAAEKFYSGVAAVARFSFKPYFSEMTEKHGVTAYVNMVATFNKGKRLGADMGDVFKDVSGYDTDDDPTGGSDNY
jgi:hypothetical protein